MSRGKNGMLRAKVPLQHQEPSNERDKLFCEFYVTHRDANRAYREAGFKSARNANANAHAKVYKFRPYLERIGAKVERAVVKKLSTDRADILQAMAQIGFANAKDYIVTTLSLDGTPIERLKGFEELTREQAAGIDELRIDPVTLRYVYTLPKAKTRLSALTALGLQTNALKAPDTQVHNHLHLEGISNEKLEELERRFIDVMGPQVSRQLLGLTEEEQTE